MLVGGPQQAAAYRYTSILMDADTGQVLADMNADDPHYPASLTKVMTLYIAFGELKAGRLTLKSKLVISRHAASRQPSKLGLRPGQTITVEQAILAMVTKSANDAACALAEGIAGNEKTFAERMTRMAHKLGMDSTEFRNASGLPNRKQVTTARDMAALARAMIHDYPEYYHYFSTNTFKFRGHVHHNHNKMLKTYPGMDGMKTGFIGASGFNLIASAVRDGRRLIGVVMGGRSPTARNARMKEMLNAGFLNQTARYAALDSKPSPNAPEPAVTAADAGNMQNWGVQVGAYSRFATAHLAAARAARNAPRLLAHGKVRIDAAADGKDKVYRARLMGLSEDRARKACEVLATKNFDCLTVAGNGSIAALITDQGDSADPADDSDE